MEQTELNLPKKTKGTDVKYTELNQWNRHKVNRAKPMKQTESKQK